MCVYLLGEQPLSKIPEVGERWLYLLLGLTRTVGKILGLTLDYETMSVAWAIREAAG